MAVFFLGWSKKALIYLARGGVKEFFKILSESGQISLDFPGTPVLIYMVKKRVTRMHVCRHFFHHQMKKRVTESLHLIFLNAVRRREMKLKLAISVVMVLMAVSGVANAIIITDGIKIDRVGASDTFTVSFLYNQWAGDENSILFAGYQIIIAAEPIGPTLPVTERAFTPGEVLIESGTMQGVLTMNGFDWLYSGPSPYQGVQIAAISDEYNGDTGIIGTFPANTPLFTFEYTGSATEFVVYDSDVDQLNEAGRIAVPAIPEPATIALLGLGAIGLLRRKK